MVVLASFRLLVEVFVEKTTTKKELKGMPNQGVVLMICFVHML